MHCFKTFELQKRKLCHLICLHPTSCNECLVLSMITSFHSKDMTYGYYHGSRLHVGAKVLIAYADFGLLRKIVFYLYIH